MRTARGFWSGVGAGCAFVVVALLVRVTVSVPTLPELVQDRLVLLLPGPIFSLLLDRFLYLGKPILFGSLLAAQLLAGGLAGIVAARLRRPVLVAAALWLLTGVVLLPLANRSPFDGKLSVALVTLLGYAAYAGAFLLFSEPTHAGSNPAGVDRRRLLAGSVLGVAAVVLARLAIGTEPSLPPRGAAGVSGGEAEGSGALDAAPGALLPGLPPAVTPADRFYLVSKNLLDPNVDAGSWRLQVQGLVTTPLSLRLADVAALPVVQDYRTLECISNEIGGDLISNGLWTGARLADVLQQAGVKQGAVAVRFTSADGYTADMPIAQALDPSTLLAYTLDGAPLPHRHGYPVRVLAIGTYGMKNPKWIVRIEVMNAPSKGFWQEQGWDEQGIVQTMAQITTPHDGARLPAGPITVAGVAFTGARGIKQVEVSADGGNTWNSAQLLPSQGLYAWSFWQLSWQPPRAAVYTLSVRATDGTGALQPKNRTDPFPSGATGYHEVRIRAGGVAATPGA
jgi:DMSO/TMAO reductase YedYZ molybdopterin-dependent catalytic subunit